MLSNRFISFFKGAPIFRGELLVSGRAFVLVMVITPEVRSLKPETNCTRTSETVELGFSDRNASTPWKVNMEPTNHPYRKENHLPKPTWLCFMFYLQGCTFIKFVARHGTILIYSSSLNDQCMSCRCFSDMISWLEFPSWVAHTPSYLVVAATGLENKWTIAS